MISIRRLATFLWLAILPAVAAAQPELSQLPDLGDSSSQVLSPQQDKALGAAFMRRIRQAGIVLDDPEAAAYLRALGYGLAANSASPGHDFTFFIVDDPSINAFAGPGGYIGANVGLFLASESESELAGVMAHEIAHVTQRHLARSFEQADRMSLPTTAAMLAAILIGATADSSAGAAALMATSAAQAQQRINFTRANEKEADSVGIQTLADAGYDPFGMPDFFGRLQKNARLYGTRPPEFLSTHPVTTNRIAEATSRAEAYPPTNKRSELDFLLVKARLRVGSYDDPKQVLSDFRRYSGNSGGDSPEKRYEFALLLDAAGQHAEALEVMQKLHRADPDRLAYRLGKGQMLANSGRPRQAMDLYAATLSLYPGSDMVMRPYAETLLTAGREEEAYELLADHSEAGATDPVIFRLLAQAAGATGRKAQRHTAMSWFYYLNGFTRQAIEQLKLAEKSPGLGHYETSRIQARIKEYQQLLQAENIH